VLKFLIRTSCLWLFLCLEETGGGSATTLPRPIPSPPSVIITTMALPPAMQDRAYKFQLAGTGCPSIFWTVKGLPSGLSATSKGLISGVPTKTGNYEVAVSARCM